MKQEEQKIYYYYRDNVKYYTPSLEYASVRGNDKDGNVYSETYMVDVIEDKKDKK